MSQPKNLRNTIEAALFSAEQPLSIKHLQMLFPASAAMQPDKIRAVLRELLSDYADRGIELVEVGGGYRFQTRQEFAPALRALQEMRPPRYSKALLETLAIIAYRQPVTRGDIEEIRGVTVTTEIMRALLEREWVRQAGHREVPGHPALYVTTPQFLQYFGLASTSELPQLGEERELVEIARELGIEMLSPANAAVAEQDTQTVETAGDTEPGGGPSEEPADDDLADPGGSRNPTGPDGLEQDPMSRVAAATEID